MLLRFIAVDIGAFVRADTEEVIWLSSPLSASLEENTPIFRFNSL